MLAKQEDVGAFSRKLDHHVSRSMDDQSLTFSRFPFDCLSDSRFIRLPKTFVFSKNRLHRSLLDPALLRKRLSLGEP